VFSFQSTPDAAEALVRSAAMRLDVPDCISYVALDECDNTIHYGIRCDKMI